MITLKTTDIYPWPYGQANAGMYLSCVLQFNSNLELLLACDDGEFFEELDLHDFFLSIDDLPTVEDKLSRFENLELSNWSMKQTFASAVCFLIQRQISRKHLQSIICVQVTNYMKFFCNEIYSDLLMVK